MSEGESGFKSMASADITNGPSERPAVSSSLLSMRKGLFGKSAGLLASIDSSNSSSDSDSKKLVEDTNGEGEKDKEEPNTSDPICTNSTVENESNEVGLVGVNTTVVDEEEMQETTETDGNSSATIKSPDRGDVYCASNGTDDSNRGEQNFEQGIREYSPISKKNHTNTTLEKDSLNCVENITDVASKDTEVCDKKAISTDEHMLSTLEEKRARSGNVLNISTDIHQESPEEGTAFSDVEMNETENPRRSSRINEKPTKISTQEKIPEETKTATSLRRGRKTELERDSDTGDGQDGVDEKSSEYGKPLTKNHRGVEIKAHSTKRGRGLKYAEVKDIVENGEPVQRVLRGRTMKTPVKAQTTKASSSVRRGRSVKEKDKVVDTESKISDLEDTETMRTPRKGLMRVKAGNVTSTKSTSKIPLPKRQLKSDGHDPYDIDTEMEKHPEPLKNIQMEVQSFGEVRYAKVGSGKYEQTEKAAESRVVNLSGMVPRTKERRSLGDFTPGRKKNAPSGSAKSAPPIRRGRNKKTEEMEDIDYDEGYIRNSDSSPRGSKIGRLSVLSIQKTPVSTSRKRRGSPPQISSVKRSNVIEIPDLDSESQWAIDHPGDEHAPHEPGARVYALFDKVFYPAVVASRDGLGRFKVRFTEDGMVKDVPPAGVIPLRALIADKECLLVDSVSGDDPLPVRVLISPNAASAVDWLKGIFQLEILDEEGKIKQNTEPISAQWNKLSLDMAEWKEYINKKSIEATKVMTDNIATTEDRHSRRSKLTTLPAATTSTAQKNQKPVDGKKSPTIPSVVVKSPAKSIRRSVKKTSTPPPQLDEKPCFVEQADVEETAASDSITPIFSGKLFILTSANRPHAEGAPGFKKKFMTDFIVSRGGLVVDDVHEVDAHPEKQWFLISDTHYRTHKYLAAMARAMPCVSHEWILKCLSQDELVSYTNYLLPSGISILDNQTYELPKERGVLLKNKRVMVHSNHQPTNPKALSFVQIWQPMIGLLGGEVVLTVPTEHGSLDVLLTDGSATPSIVEAARNIGAHVVSSEWLIQAIIMSKLPDVNANIRFKHDGGAGDRA